MKKFLLLMLLAVVTGPVVKAGNRFPDGSPIPAWFGNTTKADAGRLGRRYVVSDYGVSMDDSTLIQTEAMQRVIDMAARNGGGVIVVPRGIVMSGNLFFRQGTHLLIEKGGVLRGSDRIRDFKVMETRIEGQTCKYFPALVNADGVDGFVVAGEGTIDGNGRSYWEEFWIRREWNRQCTNKDAMRPRLIYISNSSNVTIQDVTMKDSPYWTNHIYRCHHVRFLDLRITSSTEGLLAPSTDAIDIDACHDVLVKGCYMSVNDDAVVMKGGKGTFADKDSTNGPCYRVVIEDCRFRKTHGCLTLGSESVCDRNIILRRCELDNPYNLLWLKMRPDTPQHYEYILIEHITGKCRNGISVHPWTQFYQLDDRPDMPLSQCNNIVLRNINLQCRNFFNVRLSDKYVLRDFTFEDVNVADEAKEIAFDKSVIQGTTIQRVTINGKTIK